MKDCVQTTIDELDLVKLRLVGRHHFDRLNIQNWQISPGLPSEDIIMHNIGRLYDERNVYQIFQTLKTVVISFLAIMTILSCEVLALNYFPALSTVILYLTTSLLVLFAFYCTPWLVFHSVDSENHYLKSMKEKVYINRLAMTQLLNVIIFPVFFNILLDQMVPPGYRDKPEKTVDT